MFDRKKGDYSVFFERGKNGYFLASDADKYATANFALGLIEGGHLDKFRELHSSTPYPQDVIAYGMRAAIKTKNVYLFEEIKRMYRFSDDIENTLRREDGGWANSTNLLEVFDKHVKQMNIPPDLINDINKQLKKTEAEGGYVPPHLEYPERWNKTSYHPDKHHVLIEIKKYLLGASDIYSLRRVVAQNPRYDRGMGRSTTGKLLDIVLELKGESLTPVSNHTNKNNRG